MPRTLDYSSRSHSSHLEPRSRALWEAVRLLGFWRFSLVFGVMAWGMTMTVCILIALEWLPVPQPPRPHLAKRVAALGAVCGFAWGAAMWGVMERKYRRVLAAEEGDGGEAGRANA